MIINLTAFGNFGYSLARELLSLGHLGTVFTNRPYFFINDVPVKHYQCNMFSALPYVASKLGFNQLAYKLNWSSINNFDSWVARNMTHCDIFHSFSSFGLNAQRVARNRYGAMTLVERGSSHILFQRNIINDECNLLGVKIPLADERIIEKELKEYEEYDHIVVQSSFAYRTFIEYGVSSDKLIKLPFGVDLSMFYPVPKEDKVFRVLYAGTMSIRKGSIYLLQAISKLNLKNFEFVFNGQVAEEFKDLINIYSDSIQFVGTRPRNQLYKLYSQASVFILPTIEDGFAAVITEAMACGIPVIATTNCGAEDVLTDGVEGFIVPIRDPDAIRDKILFLYENPIIRANMGQAALFKAKKLLSSNNHGLRALHAFGNAFEKFKSGK